MPFKSTPQPFNAAINAVTVGVGDKAMTLGGENVLPLYTFDAPISNPPKIGFEITDTGLELAVPGIAALYEGAATIGERAKKAETLEGVDFISLKFAGADPNGENKSAEDCAAVAKEVAEATSLPIVVEGCGNAEKDAVLFEKVADALADKNVLFLSAKEENYKAVGAAVGLAYGQKVGAESSVDINLAKQLNVLLSQLGVKNENIAINPGSAAVGYGFEYVASTMERIKAAALSQNDTSLQMPIVTPVASEAFGVKEAIVSEEDMPEWGPAEQRGIDMEISTAVSAIAYGSNAVILRHPESVKTVSSFVKAMTE